MGSGKTTVGTLLARQLAWRFVDLDDRIEEAAGLRNLIVDLAFHKGLLILGAGANAFRLSPPLLIDEEQADFALQTLETCIREAEKKA